MVTLALLFSPSMTPLENCFLCAEIIEQQFAVGAHGAGELLHRFDVRAHGLVHHRSRNLPAQVGES